MDETNQIKSFLGSGPAAKYPVKQGSRCRRKASRCHLSCPILKVVLIGDAAIVLVSWLLPAAPVIIFLVTLVILVKEARRIAGFLLG